MIVRECKEYLGDRENQSRQQESLGRVVLEEMRIMVETVVKRAAQRVREVLKGNEEEVKRILRKARRLEKEAKEERKEDAERQAIKA